MATRSRGEGCEDVQAVGEEPVGACLCSLPCSPTTFHDPDVGSPVTTQFSQGLQARPRQEQFPGGFLSS